MIGVCPVEIMKTLRILLMKLATDFMLFLRKYNIGHCIVWVALVIVDS